MYDYTCRTKEAVLRNVPVGTVRVALAASSAFHDNTNEHNKVAVDRLEFLVVLHYHFGSNFEMEKFPSRRENQEQQKNEAVPACSSSCQRAQVREMTMTSFKRTRRIFQPPGFQSTMTPI